MEDLNLRDEWAKDFPGRPFPKAGTHTDEIREWGSRVIQNYLNELGRSGMTAASKTAEGSSSLPTHANPNEHAR